MAVNNGKTEIAKQYISSHPEIAKTNQTQLAKLMFDESGAFTSIDNARYTIRYAMGNAGAKGRLRSSNKEFFHPMKNDYRPNKIVMEKAGAKILILDIETAPIRGWVWSLWKQNVGINQIDKDWFMFTWSAKWLFDKKVMSDRLTKKEALKQNDKRIVKGMWNLLNEADIVIAHNCVQKNTPVLKADLTWVKAGELVEGDELLAFDENKSTNKARQLQKSIVKSNFIKSADCYKVKFDNGDEIITTADHKWLKLAPKGRDYRWCETQNLKIGHRVEKFFTPWSTDRSYESGWLSGFISGEGTLKQSGFGFNIDYCQRPGRTLDQALKISRELGLDVAPVKKKIGGLGRGDTVYTNIRGGKFKALEILGKLRVNRLIDNIKWDRLGSLKSQSSQTCTIVSIEYIGIDEVAVMETSTKTFFANGYPMHNCNKFDIPALNTRFLMHGMKPPSPYVQIDTLRVFQKQFRFSSNKLAYINKVLGLKEKIETGGFELWSQCYAGHNPSLIAMEKYNIGDVVALEDLYLLIRAWIKPHPPVSIYILDGETRCPTCGSKELQNQKGGDYVTQVNVFETVRCKGCGAVARKRKSSIKVHEKETLLISVAR